MITLQESDQITGRLDIQGVSEKELKEEWKGWVTLNRINTKFEDFSNMVKTKVRQKKRKLLALGKKKRRSHTRYYGPNIKQAPIKCDMTLENN